ncbi:hypothetical protein PAXRUDRAFT_441512 [Paxillus rubicundulus Ve08.2h10]|uniref:Uncharacterized protein n=1 Tax=Paxillus rubicundulus Ve08.2h10 TaxID=930991 RepID=A0A0D0DD34_9AGAM|nr:hypothetical protein PAXRUDRAFT_174899 [Paxillus rubicundulus Ve08.2h10]KIK75275.1 hypothetical protein PAXRUDRAFT_173304 [Paxillus rubicundulus Ve08.2h10]KIK76257.1 hypothetical protein PAXRUDRAFT_441512 [Paxillus rubicundulus Ve08.2h10]
MVYPNWDTPMHLHSHVDSIWLPPLNVVARFYSSQFTGLPTSTSSYQAFPPPHSHNSQSTHEQISSTPYTSSELSRTSFAGHLPQTLQHPRDHNTRNSDDRALVVPTAPEANYLAQIQEGSLTSHASLSGTVTVKGPSTSEDVRK